MQDESPVKASESKLKQLSDARLKKAEKAAQRAQDLLDLKSKLDSVEQTLKQNHDQLSTKLSDTEQKLMNSELDHRTKLEMTDQKQKVVTLPKETTSETKPEKTNWIGSLTQALPILVALGSVLVKAGFSSFSSPIKPEKRKSPPVEESPSIHKAKRPSLFPSQDVSVTSLFH